MLQTFLLRPKNWLNRLKALIWVLFRKTFQSFSIVQFNRSIVRDSEDFSLLIRSFSKKHLLRPGILLQDLTEIFLEDSTASFRERIFDQDLLEVPLHTFYANFSTKISFKLFKFFWKILMNIFVMKLSCLLESKRLWIELSNWQFKFQFESLRWKFQFSKPTNAFPSCSETTAILVNHFKPFYCLVNILIWSCFDHKPGLFNPFDRLTFGRASFESNPILHKPHSTETHSNPFNGRVSPDE